MTTSGPGAQPSRIDGTLERIVFSNATTGYAVAHLREHGSGRMVTVVGSISHVGPGSSVVVWGRWVTNPRYGLQFEVTECAHSAPADPQGIERFLASGLVKGIGPRLANKLVERFGARTLQVIEETPELLSQVKGLGRARAERLRESLAGQRSLKEAAVFLATHGIGLGLASRIHRQYRDRTMTIVQTDPYRMVREVTGVGFKTADSIALRVGLALEAPPRIRAAVAHVLDEAVQAGHCFLPRSELVTGTRQLLGLEEGILGEQIDAMAAAGELVVEPDVGAAALPRPAADPGVFLPALCRLETQVARTVARLAGSRPAFSLDKVREALERVERHLGVVYHPLQRQGILQLATGNVLIITGGPGTGKTTLLKGVIEVIRTLGRTFTLAAPTGRAAKRIEESTGYQASTLHRLLRYQPQTHRFLLGRSNPLTVGAIAVDESSMIDLPLFSSLLEAITPGTVLVIVGDVDQLPSIGPGTVLEDLIAAGLPTVRLSHIFRQSQHSWIVDNAHRVNQGLMPVVPSTSQETLGDFYFLERPQPESIASTVVELVTSRIPRRFGFDPLRDIQVLVPMYRGEMGVDNINRLLRERLNRAAPLAGQGDPTLRAGDKVIQQVNDYDRDVFNGDVGVIASVDPETGIATVDFEGRPVVYRREDLAQLQLAYAVSVHKAQGSEYPAVVIPLHTQHWVLLQRNLLYTALTRAKKLAVLVGSRRALRAAVASERVVRRHTRLARRLRQELASG
ncbi:MAG: ATP-dependent RecD-like DNA helicase [Candidatus Riflebacteria bacterium]|nr:ATP-dependent RecD-like DNA helicase [Candidatus Riflebacteria bacterium]